MATIFERVQIYFATIYANYWWEVKLDYIYF